MMTPARWRLSTWMLGFALMDQVSKWLARAMLSPQQSFVLLPKVFQLTLAYNTGAAFSMLNQQPQLLTLFTTVIFGILLTYGLGRTRFLPGEIPAFSLILGGALGNLTDRFLWGRVTDFLDVTLIHYPIFNLADILIFSGVILLIIVHLRPYPAETESAGRLAPPMEPVKATEASLHLKKSLPPKLSPEQAKKTPPATPPSGSQSPPAT
jgi:signal peptidase II